MGPVSAAAGLDWADGRAGPSYSRYYSVTCRPSPCLLTDSEMTVLEQDKTGPTMSDRYITPEYLAHLPTSVSSTPGISTFQIILLIISIVILARLNKFSPDWTEIP